MTWTVRESSSPDDTGQARERPRLWLYVSLAWGAIVALIAGLLDRSWLVAAGWLLSGLTLGFVGPWLLRALGLLGDVAFRWYDDLWGGPEVFDLLDDPRLATDEESSQQLLDEFAERNRNAGDGGCQAARSNDRSGIVGQPSGIVNDQDTRDIPDFWNRGGLQGSTSRGGSTGSSSLFRQTFRGEPEKRNPYFAAHDIALSFQ